MLQIFTPPNPSYLQGFCTHDIAHVSQLTVANVEALYWLPARLIQAAADRVLNTGKRREP